MAQQTWDSLTKAQRIQQRDYSGLTTQLIGLEGWRVEVTDRYRKTWRFIVGVSTGWRPCHLEIKTRRSSGGSAADAAYARVTRLEKVR